MFESRKCQTQDQKRCKKVENILLKELEKIFVEVYDDINVNDSWKDSEKNRNIIKVEFKNEVDSWNEEEKKLFKTSLTEWDISLTA